MHNAKVDALSQTTSLHRFSVLDLPSRRTYLHLFLSGLGVFLLACFYCALHGFESSQYAFDLRVTLGWAVPNWGAWPFLLPLCFWLLRSTYSRTPSVVGLTLTALVAVLGATLFSYIVDVALGHHRTLFGTAYHITPMALATIALASTAGYLHLITRHRSPDDSLAVYKGTVTRSIKPDDIEWARAAKNYVELYADGATYIRRSSMDELARRCGGNLLLRVHRSYFVRPECVRGFSGGRSKPVLLMSSGSRIPVGPSHRDSVFRTLSLLGIRPKD